MNVSADLSKNIETILPILFFIGWLIVSFFAQKKRSSTQKPPQQSETTNNNRSGDFAGDLKKTLETIFGELSGVEQQPEPAYKNEHTYDNQEEADESTLEHTAAAPVSLPEPIKPIKQKEINAYTLKESPIDGKNEITADAFDQTIDRNRPMMAFTIKEAREGFIWSEILLPPVSLRE